MSVEEGKVGRRVTSTPPTPLLSSFAAWPLDKRFVSQGRLWFFWAKERGLKTQDWILCTAPLLVLAGKCQTRVWSI